MAVRSNRCVTGRRPCDNYAVRFRQNRESGVKRGTRSWPEASRTSLMTRLATGCKCWHRLAPGRRYGTRSSLSEYMSLHLSLKLTTNSGPLSRIKWYIFFIKKCSVRSLSLIMFLVVHKDTTEILQHKAQLEICNPSKPNRRLYRHGFRQTLCSSTTQHRHFYHHCSNGSLNVALLLKCQSDLMVTSPVKKRRDELTKHHLGSLIQKFIRHYSSKRSSRQEEKKKEYE